MDALVSTEWLAREQGAADLRILDATYHALDPSRDAGAEYRAGHIAGAMFMGLGGLADPDTTLPGMLPPPELFARRMQALGVGRDDRIVLYDSSQHHTAARAWWMLTTFGASQVAILDGGLPKWTAEGRPVVTTDSNLPEGRFEAVKDAAAVRDRAQMKANVADRAEQVIDARSALRFGGGEPEPRAGVSPGHIPGSVNLPYERLFEADGTFKRGEALKAEFDAVGIDLSRPIVTTCGSGVTAAIVLFAARLLGAERTALYDGSWSEWGADPTTEKAIS